MHLTFKLLLLTSILFLSGCATTIIPRGWKKKDVKYLCTTSKPVVKSLSKKLTTFAKAKRKTFPNICVCKQVVTTKSYKKFKSTTNLRKSFKVFKDKKLLAKAISANTALRVDVSEQRVRLYVDNKIALDAPCTTGAKHKFEPNTKIYRDKRTPKGTFKILEKIRHKRSTIFGNYYRGKKRVYHGDRHKFKGSKKGLRYEGAELKNWMRLTGGGIGLHASKYVKRYPGTNGCIRLPYKVSQTIFKHVHKGTKVSIVN